jgi:uncharacterized protein with HEPN domain
MSIDPHILKLLDDICTAAERISIIVENETLESFLSPASMNIQDAVARRFTVIGEASAALLRKYPDFCKEYKEISFREAKGLRNFIVHDYDGIDWQIIFEAAKNDIPELLDAIKKFRS